MKRRNTINSMRIGVGIFLHATSSILASGLGFQPSWYRPPLLPLVDTRAPELGQLSAYGLTVAGTATSAFNEQGENVPLLFASHGDTVLQPMRAHLQEYGFLGVANLTKHAYMVVLVPYYALQLRHETTGMVFDREESFGNVMLAGGLTGKTSHFTSVDNLDATCLFGALLPTITAESIVTTAPLTLGFSSTPGLFTRGTVAVEKGIVKFGVTSTIIAFSSSPLACLRGGEYARPGLYNDCYLYGSVKEIMPGLSAMLSYVYQHQGASVIYPADTHLPLISRRDPRLSPWESHSIATDIMYNFATPLHPDRPNIHLFFSKIVGGKRVASSWLLGSVYGFEITTNY
jgi:hypothetical protein